GMMDRVRYLVRGQGVCEKCGETRSILEKKGVIKRDKPLLYSRAKTQGRGKYEGLKMCHNCMCDDEIEFYQKQKRGEK
ncbi:hypothetical protein, partial [Bacillus cereus group sp. BfR-BA-01489]|uniref:hypothetical protein n=1 Tax=Bacillus cereus group sp. BfR-BA-01489 TaxID=2920358 RepID=UPI001F597737